MSEKNYYNILGVDKNAKASEIKKAFRRLALKYHPDRNQGNKTSEQKFKEINEAYEVLKDEQKRNAYDKYGSSAFQQSENGFNYKSSNFEDFSDVFENIFEDFMGKDREKSSTQQKSQRNFRGADLRYNTEIKLEEAYTGATKKIKFRTYLMCNDCDGNGTKIKNNTLKCNACNGSGKVRYQQGFFMIEKSCTNCSGYGIVIKDPCSKCNGEGRYQKEKSLLVKIPKGIINGAKIKIISEGEAGIRKAQQGDLYIYISIKSHEFYQIDGLNLHCSAPIKMTTAILGGCIEIPTIDGNVAKVNIPAGTQYGTKLRIRNKGMPKINSLEHGDIYVYINIELPVKISSKQKELLKNFDQINQFGTNPKTEGFFAKVKKFVTDFKK